MMQKIWRILFASFFGIQVGCSGQQFSVPPEELEYGQTATYSKQVDVLFVVDSSTSMSSRQEFLSQQMPTFIEALNKTGLDYQLGVTTMDMRSDGAAGRLISQASSPAILRSSTPQLVPLLMGRIRAGENGSPVERGLEAMLRALTLSAPEGPNAGFLRAEALLNVIFLTDEEDQSDSSVDYIAELNAIKPPLANTGERSWIVHFLGVRPDDSRCRTAEWNFSSPGVRYIQLAEVSDGAADSICDGNFERALRNVRARLLEVQTEFKLGRKANEDTIVVRVNGRVVPKDRVNGWSYRDETRSIRFHGTAIPGANDRIQIVFDPAEIK